MYHSLGQPAVDLTRFPCIESALCQSGGDPSLICCGNIPGAAGGTCMTRTSCTQAGYSERQATALPALPAAQEDAPSIWASAGAQIVVGVTVAVGVALTLNHLSSKTGRRYAPNAAKVMSIADARRERERGQNWIKATPSIERGTLMDSLVLGDFDWMDYGFERKPSRAFLSGAFDELQYLEETNG